MTTNPALDELRFLAGRWDMEVSEASFLPNPEARLRGPVTFEWIEQGAALVLRMGGAGTPTATASLGKCEAEPSQPRGSTNAVRQKGFLLGQLVKVGSPPRIGSTRPLGSSQSSWRPRAVRSRRT
jgi:hypothetical protein